MPENFLEMRILLWSSWALNTPYKYVMQTLPYNFCFPSFAWWMNKEEEWLAGKEDPNYQITLTNQEKFWVV